MKVLAGLDKFKFSMSSEDACAAAASAVELAGSSFQLEVLPLSDGGEGFCRIVTKALHGSFATVETVDSLGRPAWSEIGLSGNRAIVEYAACCGLASLSKGERNPWKTSSQGLGKILLWCAQNNVEEVLLGLGGSSTSDMGMGAAKELGANFEGASEFLSPDVFDQVQSVTLPKKNRELKIKIICDVENPLFGENGAVCVYAKQKGCPEEELDLLERNNKALLKKLKNPPGNLHELVEKKGMGAAGGAAFGLSLILDVEMIAGFDFMEEIFSLKKKVEASDLIVTGEGRLDSSSFDGKGVFKLARLALDQGKRVVFIAGSVDSSILALLPPGMELIVLQNEKMSIEESLKKAPERLKEKLASHLKSPC